VVFVVALLFSMTGLAFAMRSLPTGTSYAVWVGMVGCIVGLKLVS
jgi:quaternary ammonium compound-resistance protein SugE